MHDDRVLTSREGAVSVLTFNRPESLNALDVPLLLAIEKAFGELSNDPEVRVIVLTGIDDRAFMVGGDINDLNGRRGLAHYNEYGDAIQRVFRRIEVCPKPTICAVNGLALGGGMQLMLCTDLRVVAVGVRIGLPEVKLGLFPGGGGSQRLMRQLPACKAKLLMFTGDSIDAQEALELGLVNMVVPQGLLLDETLALARRIAQHSPIALGLLKKAMVYGAEMPLGPALEYEHAMISLVLDSDDAHEGCNAFIEKRPPRFLGN